MATSSHAVAVHPHARFVGVLGATILVALYIAVELEASCRCSVAVLMGGPCDISHALCGGAFILRDLVSPVASSSSSSSVLPRLLPTRRCLSRLSPLSRLSRLSPSASAYAALLDPRLPHFFPSWSSVSFLLSRALPPRSLLSAPHSVAFTCLPSRARDATLKIALSRAAAVCGDPEPRRRTPERTRRRARITTAAPRPRARPPASAWHRSWPLRSAAPAAAVLSPVERLGRWPTGLRANCVALLPKGGSAAPGDQRPIVLLPVVYRIWAALRGRLLQTWLLRCGRRHSEGIFGERGVRESRPRPLYAVDAVGRRAGCVDAGGAPPGARRAKHRR